MSESRTGERGTRRSSEEPRQWVISHARVCPSLVGRREELAALIERRNAAARGRGSLVLIEGDAGIGKSRLVNEFCSQLSNGRAALGWGACREFGTSPYAPITAAARKAGCELSPEPAATRADELMRLRTAITTACAHRNRVLVIEDIQWADEGTLAFLHYALSFVGGTRLLVVATYRADEVLAQHVGPYLNRLTCDRATSRIILTPLLPARIRELIRLALGARQLPREQIEEIVSRSDGNPFFTEELLTNALDHNGSLSTKNHLPMTIRAAVMERVAKVDPLASQIATRAAAIGLHFEAGFLSSTFGYTVSDVSAALRQLCDMKLLDEIEQHPPTYAFRHALTREAIYNSMLAAEAQPIHARILQSLEVDGSAKAQDLGYHAWAAQHPSKCRYYNELAGDDADAVHAYSDALRYYEMALQGECDDDTRARLLLKSAGSCSRDGLAARAAQLYGSAAALLSGHATPQQMADIYYAMGSQVRVSGDNRSAIAIIDRAARALPAFEIRAKAMLRVTSAFMHLDRGDVTLARALIAQAGAVSDLPIYQNALAYAALNDADLDALHAANSEHMRLSEQQSHEHLLRARFNQAFHFSILGIDGEAVADFDALIPELERARLSSLQVLSYANAALVHCRMGRLHVARDLVDRGLAIPEPTTVGPIALAAAGISVGHALDDAALVERCTSERILESAFASNINSTLGRIAGPYARWLHACGDAGYARDILRRAMNRLSAPLGATETFTAAAELGDEATQRTSWQFLGAIDALSHLKIYAVTAHHIRACRARFFGETTISREHARKAALLYRHLGWSLHEARCLEIAEDHERCLEQYSAVRSASDLRRIAPLSSREREIAALVADGTENGRIAKRLAVSQRTVEKHLTSIYAKLGLRNRAELAAFVSRSAR
jgi:DNA-binding CsgD family transcriptional regulator